MRIRAVIVDGLKIFGTDRLIYRYDSLTTLNQNVVRLLEHSNNFITNQLLIATGAKIIGSPGTLYGISTRAGYIRRSNGQLCRYVIMLNTPGKSAEPLALRLLRILE